MRIEECHECEQAECCEGGHSEQREMGRECGTQGDRSTLYAWFWWGDQKERDSLDGLDVDGTMILKWI